MAVQREPSSKEKAGREIQSAQAALKRARHWALVGTWEKPSRKASRRPGSGILGIGELLSCLKAIWTPSPPRHPTPAFRGGSPPNSVSEDLPAEPPAHPERSGSRRWRRGGCSTGGGRHVPRRAVALGSCANASHGGGAARWPLGAGPGRGVGPRGRCGRAEVAQPAASPTCAQRGTKPSARGPPGRPQQVSGRGDGRAASTRGTRDEVAPQGAWGAERDPAQPPALGHTPGAARDPRARRGPERAVAASALRWGVPARPTHHSKLRVLGNFPGCSGRVNRNQARARKTQTRTIG